jgi:hypothetical protein
MSLSEGCFGGCSLADDFIASSMVTAVSSCFDFKATSRCSMSSMRPFISIISCTAVWNLPCTFRRRHAACSTVAFSDDICSSVATSSIAESTTSYGPWPVRSDSPLTLRRSFCRCNFGSDQRSLGCEPLGEKKTISCCSPSSHGSSEDSSSAAKSTCSSERASPRT